MTLFYSDVCKWLYTHPIKLIFLQTHLKNYFIINERFGLSMRDSKVGPASCCTFLVPSYWVPIVSLLTKSCQTIFDQLDFQREWCSWRALNYEQFGSSNLAQNRAHKQTNWTIESIFMDSFKKKKTDVMLMFFFLPFVNHRHYPKELGGGVWGLRESNRTYMHESI